MGFQQRDKSDDKVVQATENLERTLRDHVLLLMQDLDLLDKSGVRQHFRFVANRYDVAKAPWEDIVDTLSEMLPSCMEICCRIWAGEGSGAAKSGYDWTLNAVRIAEKRPALASTKLRQLCLRKAEIASVAHVNEKRVYLFVPPFHHLITVLLHFVRRVQPCFRGLCFAVPIPIPSLAFFP